MRRHRNARRESRVDGAQHLAVLLCLLVLLLLHSSTGTVRASSTFPGRLPPLRYEQSSNSSRRGLESADGASSDDGGDVDEIESSSEDESLWGPPLTSTIRQPRSGSGSGADSPLPAAARTTAERSYPSQEASSPTTTLRNGTQPNAGAGAPRINETAVVAPPLPSRPLQTLQKLQNMLDETDYLTTSRRKQQSTEGAGPDSSLPSIGQASSSTSSKSNATTIASSSSEPGRLWTSKDRAKYKKQQHKIRKKQEELLLQQSKDEKARSTPFHVPQSSPPIHPFSDDEQEQTSDDFDDGLGFSLPNVPVYYSDAEGDSDPGTDAPPPTAPLSDPSLQQGPSAPRNVAESVPYHSHQHPRSLNFYEPQRMAPSSSHQTFGPPPRGETVPQQQFYPPHPPYHPNGYPYMYQPSHYGPYLLPPAYHGQFGSWSPAVPPLPGFAHSRAAYPAGIATPRQYPARGVIQHPPAPPPPPPQPGSTTSVETNAQVGNITLFEDTRRDPASTADSSTSRELSLTSPPRRQDQQETAVSYVDPHMNYYGMAPAYFIAPENVRTFDGECYRSSCPLTCTFLDSHNPSQKQAHT